MQVVALVEFTDYPQHTFLLPYSSEEFGFKTKDYVSKLSGLFFHSCHNELSKFYQLKSNTHLLSHSSIDKKLRWKQLNYELRAHEAQMKMGAGLGFCLETLRKNLFLTSVALLAQFSSLPFLKLRTLFL